MPMTDRAFRALALEQPEIVGPPLRQRAQRIDSSPGLYSVPIETMDGL